MEGIWFYFDYILGAERQRQIKDQIFAPSIATTSSLRIPGGFLSVDIGLSERLHVPIAHLPI